MTKIETQNACENDLYIFGVINSIDGVRLGDP